MPKVKDSGGELVLPAVQFICIDFLAPDPAPLKPRRGKQRLRLLRKLIQRDGFDERYPLLVVRDRRTRRKEDRFIVVDGETRLEFVRVLRPEITELPCRVLDVSLDEARSIAAEHNSPAQGACKSLTLAQLLIEALDRAHTESKGSSFKLTRDAKETINLIAGYTEDQFKTIYRASGPLREIYRELCHLDPANTDKGFAEVMLRAIEKGEPLELKIFFEGGSAYAFEQNHKLRTRVPIEATQAFLIADAADQPRDKSEPAPYAVAEPTPPIPEYKFTSAFADLLAEVVEHLRDGGDANTHSFVDERLAVLFGEYPTFADAFRYIASLTRPAVQPMQRARKTRKQETSKPARKNKSSDQPAPKSPIPPLLGLFG